MALDALMLIPFTAQPVFAELLAMLAAVAGCDVGANCDFWCLLGSIGSGIAGSAFKDHVKDLFRDAWDAFRHGWQRMVDNVKTAYEAITTATKEVFGPIGESIQDILGSGEIPDQTDGGLGETQDIFQKGAEDTLDVKNPLGPTGEMPGYGYDGVGSGSGGGGGGGGGGSGGGTTPLGGGESSPPSGDAPPPGDTQAPTHEDLGLDPDDGAFIEHQPGEGQVVIHYPDGTTEVVRWP